MTTEVRLDHTIVHVRDNRESAEFLAGVLGLPAPKLIGGKFFAVRLGEVSLDFDTTEGEIVAQHYAFAVGAGDFDAILARVRSRGLPFWADPQRTRPNEVAERGGGERAFYFADPSGHWLEVLTRFFTTARQ